MASVAAAFRSLLRHAPRQASAMVLPSRAMTASIGVRAFSAAPKVAPPPPFAPRPYSPGRRAQGQDRERGAVTGEASAGVVAVRGQGSVLLGLTGCQGPPARSALCVPLSVCLPVV